jgi:hypothetical protein
MSDCDGVKRDLFSLGGTLVGWTELYDSEELVPAGDSVAGDSVACVAVME